VVDLEGNMFGLEVNRIVPCKVVPFAGSAIAVQRLKLRRP
jgi:hypothetical protein